MGIYLDADECQVGGNNYPAVCCLRKSRSTVCSTAGWKRPRSCAHAVASAKTQTQSKIGASCRAYNTIAANTKGLRRYRQGPKGRAVKGRVVRIYRRPWNTHARRSRNERSCQSRSRVISGLPSLTGLTIHFI